ncbi:hypothetical protein [Frigoribacterium sp. VKM Ac-2836]|nr:hypothetical protein [Frigoribacterium sp. VKM Ac-2836]NRD25614.1 hypothetical protein [Frigoribacterium sp. VKM Ac-2836]
MFVTPVVSATATASTAAGSIDPASIALPGTRQVDVTSYVVEAFARL